MYNRLLFFLFGCCLTVTTFGQDGYYFHSQFSPMEDSRDQYHYDIEQDPNGKLFFANRYGLLSFDGSTWNIIETEGPVFSLIEHDSVIYATGTRGFGKIERDPYGNLVYKNAGDTSRAMRNVTMLIKDDSLLYMSNGENLVTYSPYLDQFTVSTIDKEITGLLEFDNQLFLQTTDGIENLGQNTAVNRNFLNGGPWTFCKGNPSIARWILANTNNELYVFDGFDLKPLLLDDQGYLKESKMLTGEWLRDDLFAIGTLRGGTVFINPKTKKVDQIVNYHTGLPDNETQTLFVDHKSALWVSHPYGYTRVAPDIPFRSYNYYPGLDGALYSSTLFESTVYVGTNLGLFYLDQLKDFNEIVYYVKKNPNTNLTEDSGEGKILSFLNFSKEKQSAKQEKEPPKEEEKKGGFLSFIRKSKQSNSQPLQQVKEPPKKPASKTSKPVYEKKVRKELQSITDVYKKVSGIDGRIAQLININDRQLIAAGLDGVFIVQNASATKIYDEAIKYIYHSTKHNQLLASTYNGDLVSIYQEKNRWVHKVLLDNLEEYVQYILEEGEKIWLCTTRKLYWIELASHEIATGGELDLPNAYLDPVVAVKDDSLGTLVIHGHGFFQLTNDSLKPVSFQGMEKPTRYLASKQHILISDGRSWHVLGSGSREQKSFPFLNVFDNIISLDYESDGNLWVITGDNEFYRINSESTFASDYNPFLKKIESVDNQLLPIGNRLVVEQENSSLSFHFHQPEYSGIMQINYRYKLEGLNEKWSEWSAKNNIIEFPYLPPNAYTLQVETRNVFGTIKSMEPIYFKVVPPYWKRPWFYALEFAFFALLFIISARLSKARHYHFQVLNRILAFLTIIMVIEFIQTLVEVKFETNQSPVIDFFLQVFVAFCLLPLEFFMRGRLFKKSAPKADVVPAQLDGQIKKLLKRGQKTNA